MLMKIPYSRLQARFVNRGGDTMTGALTLLNNGLHILDTDASHDLIISPGSDLSADKTLTLTTGDSDRTITLTGNPTLADWFDQSVKIASSPTLAGLTISGLTVSRLVASDGSKGIVSTSLASWMASTANQVTVTDDGDGTVTLSTPQDIAAGSSPTFTGLTLSGLTATRLVSTNGSSVLASSDLASWVAGTGNQITVGDDGDGTITLSTPQDIAAGSSPTFTGLTLSGLSNGLVKSATGVLSGGHDHGDTGGLGDDDHTQYLLASGARALSGPWNPGQIVTFTNAGLHILDTNASHDLIISPGSDLTGDKTLTLTTGDASRTITLSGDPTLADWFDQAVKVASSPTHVGLTLSGLTATRLVSTDGSSVLTSSDLAAWVAGTTNQIAVGDDGDGTITLSTPQDIHSGASPSFVGLTLTGNITMADDTWIGIASDAERIVFDSAGDVSVMGAKVGIGTLAPNSQFSLATGAYTFGLDSNADAFSADLAQIVMTGAGGSAPFDQAGSLIYKARTSATDGRSSHLFYTGDPNLQRMRISETGQVGIGIDPTQFVHAYKDFNGSVIMRMENPNVGASAIGMLSAESDTAEVSLRAYSSIFSDATFAGKSGLIGSSASAVLFGNLNAGAGEIHFITRPSAYEVQVRISNLGNVGIGAASFGTNANTVLAQATGVAPASSPADMFQMYSADFGGAAGKACAHFRNEDGDIIKLEQQNKADYNNWTAFTDVVDALVAMGIFDAA